MHKLMFVNRGNVAPTTPVKSTTKKVFNNNFAKHCIQDRNIQNFVDILGVPIQLSHKNERYTLRS
jgi:hypothetical protein